LGRTNADKEYVREFILDDIFAVHASLFGDLNELMTQPIDYDPQFEESRE
jgi:hypothetical protein